MTVQARCGTALAMAAATTRDLPGRLAGASPRPLAAARDVVALATLAPSIHNTQPWRWRIVSEDVLELFADHDRRLPVVDPRGRLLTVSLGAALHHAVVAARASDRSVAVERLPAGGPPDLVARLRLGDVTPAGPAERIGLASLVARRTDRRPFSPWGLPEDRLRHLGAVAASYGVTTVRLDLAQRLAVQRLVAGVPDRLVDQLGLGRCHDGVLPGAAGEDCGSQHTAVLALCHPRDDAEGWLAGGEALSAVWLEAVCEGLGVVPLSLPVEVPEVRERVREDVLGLQAQPLLLLQVGWPHTSSARLPRSPRRPLDAVIVP